MSFQKGGEAGVLPGVSRKKSLHFPHFGWISTRWEHNRRASGQGVPGDAGKAVRLKLHCPVPEDVGRFTVWWRPARRDVRQVTSWERLQCAPLDAGH